MKKNVCPGCGGQYNGKRCRNCGYEPFTEEIACGSPTGTPPAADAPVRRKRKKRPFLGFLILLYLIYALMPLLREWGQKLEAMEDMARKTGQHSTEVPHG